MINKKLTKVHIFALLWMSSSMLGSVAMAHPREESSQPDAAKDKETHTALPHSYKPKSQKEALLIDSRLVAEKYGWKLEETYQHLKNQQAFSAFVAKLEAEYGKVFASSAMAAQPGELATIWVKEVATADMKKLIEQFNGNSQMQVRIVDKMRYSAIEQEKRMDQISDALFRKGFTGVGAALLPGNIMLVSVPASENFPPSEIPKNAKEARFDRNFVDPMAAKLLPEEVDSRGIYFTFTKQPIDVDEHARGGRGVSSGSSSCTSGFSVERISDGLNGIATAAHCTGINTFDAEPPEGDFSLFHRDEHCGEHGDVEWKTSDHFELAEYWAGPGDLRNVNSIEVSYSVNNTYCVHSRVTSTRSCDQVYSTSVTQKGSLGACDGVKAKRLIAMDNDNTVPGDSGGPWSFGTEAAGIHKGNKWIWFGTRNTFTKASRLDEALGVRIRTQ